MERPGHRTPAFLQAGACASCRARAGVSLSRRSLMSGGSSAMPHNTTNALRKIERLQRPASGRFAPRGLHLCELSGFSVAGFLGEAQGPEAGYFRVLRLPFLVAGGKTFRFFMA